MMIIAAAAINEEMDDALLSENACENAPALTGQLSRLSVQGVPLLRMRRMFTRGGTVTHGKPFAVLAARMAPVFPVSFLEADTNETAGQTGRNEKSKARTGRELS
jgi:hypothetical protein